MNSTKVNWQVELSGYLGQLAALTLKKGGGSPK